MAIKSVTGFEPKARESDPASQNGVSANATSDATSGVAPGVVAATELASLAPPAAKESPTTMNAALAGNESMSPTGTPVPSAAKCPAAIRPLLAEENPSIEDLAEIAVFFFGLSAPPEVGLASEMTRAIRASRENPGHAEAASAAIQKAFS